MNQINPIQSDDEEEKLLDNKKNSIENLSNEVLLEIFDYLDGFTLYETFWNLNSRFQNLLSSPSVLLKINFLELCPSDSWMEFLLLNKHKIISIDLRYALRSEFFHIINIITLFHRLESFCLFAMRSKDLIPILQNLISLPRLFALVLSATSNFYRNELGEIYPLIFSFPVLKYIKLSSSEFERMKSLPVNDNNQHGTIKCMIIDHVCRFDELLILLSYTPQLRRLTCSKSLDSAQLIEQKILLSLSKLRYIDIEECRLEFEELESFIMRIGSQLRVMRIVTAYDSVYLDANRWERLISQHIPHLCEFYFRYRAEDASYCSIENEYHTLIHQFTSSFWIERQWILQFEINRYRKSGRQIIYSICPHKKEWYNLPEDVECFKQDSQLTVKCTASTELIIRCDILEDIIPLLRHSQITELNIQDGEVSFGTLIELISHLPNLDALRVFSFCSQNLGYLTAEGTDICPSTLNNNKITKVNVGRVRKLAEAQSLLEFCPLIKYLEIENWSDIDHKSFVRFILKENKPHLHTLSLCIVGNIDQTISELKQMINFDKLCHDYRIKYINGKIYLQWN